MSTFALDVGAFVRKTKDTSDLVLRKIALEALSGTVLMTPVKTGRARGNWQVSIGAPTTSYDNEKLDPSGGGAIAEGSSVIAEAVAGGPSIWLANNLPYIRRLEYGWSRQAPSGMLRITIARIKASLGLV